MDYLEPTLFHGIFTMTVPFFEEMLAHRFPSTVAWVTWDRLIRWSLQMRGIPGWTWITSCQAHESASYHWENHQLLINNFQIFSTWDKELDCHTSMLVSSLHLGWKWFPGLVTCVMSPCFWGHWQWNFIIGFISQPRLVPVCFLLKWPLCLLHVGSILVMC